jgi:hypothetical protein
MKNTVIHIGILLLMTQIGIAQDLFSETQLKNFVDIYMDSKKTKNMSDYELVTSEKMKAHGISNARYKEIFQTSISNKKVELSKNEISFFDEIQKAEDLIKREQNAKLRAECTSRSFNYNTYLEIKGKYHSDIKFQRSLKPYFDQYFKTRK